MCVWSRYYYIFTIYAQLRIQLIYSDRDLSSTHSLLCIPKVSANDQCPCPSLEPNPVVCLFLTTFYPFEFGKNSGILMEAYIWTRIARSSWEFYFENLIFTSNQFVSSCDSVRHEIAYTKALDLTKIKIEKVVLQKLFSYVFESFVAMVNETWWIWKAFHSLMNRRHFYKSSMLRALKIKSCWRPLNRIKIDWDAKREREWEQIIPISLQCIGWFKWICKW